VAFAHVAVEVFHDQDLAAGRPLPKVVCAAQEMGIGQDLEPDLAPDLDLCRPDRLPDLLRDAVFSRLDQAYTPRAVQFEGMGQAAAETRGPRRIDIDVVDLPALAAQPVGVVAHRAQEQRGARLVRWDPGRLAPRLDHQDTIGLAVAVVEQRRAAVELVAQHEEEIATGQAGSRGARRHRSEQ
jgi:hypothetical protein